MTRAISFLLGVALIGFSFVFAVLELRTTKTSLPTSHLVFHGTLIALGLIVAGYAKQIEEVAEKVLPFLKRSA